MNYENAVMVLLSDFIGNTERLVTLLQEDREYFKQADLWHLEESNIKKNDIHKQLNQLLVELQAFPSLSGFEGTICQKLSLLTASMPENNRKEIDTMLEKLQSALQNYRESVAVNRQVIARSSSFIKHLFLTVMASRKSIDSGSVYNCMGTLENP